MSLRISVVDPGTAAAGRAGCPLPPMSARKRGHRARHDRRCAPRRARTRGWDRRYLPSQLTRYVDDRPPPIGGERRRITGVNHGGQRGALLGTAIVHLIPHRARRVGPSHARWDFSYCCDAMGQTSRRSAAGADCRKFLSGETASGATDPTARWEADTLMRPPRFAANICSHRDTACRAPVDPALRSCRRGRWRSARCSRSTRLRAVAATDRRSRCRGTAGCGSPPVP